MTDWTTLMSETPLDARIRIFREQKDLAELLGTLMHLSLHCRIEVQPVVALHAMRIYLRQVGEDIGDPKNEDANNLNLRQFAQLLRAIDRNLPRSHFADLTYWDGHVETNPSNGHIRYFLTLGMELSPVLYIEDYNGISPEHRKAIKKAARDAGADEVSVSGKDGTKMRIWWD